MARPSIDQIRGLGDFSSLFRWDLQFSTIPGAVSPAPTIDELNFRCESASLPTANQTSAEVNIRGHKTRQPGILTYNGTIELTFIETIDSKIHSFLKGWREACWATKTGVAAAAVADLKGEILIIRLDNQDNQIWQYRLVGVYLENYTLPNLDGTSSDFMRPALTFSYDYFEDKKL